MLHTGEKYINPLTDFGFKRIFGTEFNKELLVSFLNAILDGERVITDVTFKNSEHLGTSERERRAIFDVYCTTDKGARIIVEMQNVYQEFYKDRSIYYSTFPIAEQAQQGEWKYQLDDVYTVGILNFTFPEDKRNDSCVYREVKLMDVKSKEVFYDKLTYLYVELANFNKALDECASILDKWVYCLKNLSNLMSRPAELQERVFARLFKTAEIAKLNTEDKRAYELSVNAYRDIKNGIDAAKKEGREEGKKEGIAIGKAEGIAIGKEQGIAIGKEQGKAQGRAQGINEIAKKMLEEGMPCTTIAKLTGLAVDEIEDLDKNNNDNIKFKS